MGGMINGVSRVEINIIDRDHTLISERSKELYRCAFRKGLINSLHCGEMYSYKYLRKYNSHKDIINLVLSGEMVREGVDPLGEKNIYRWVG